MENQRERIKLNVGGRIFETTISTLQSGGPDSLLWALSTRPNNTTGDSIFIDRDPEIFSVLLSLLRTNRFPSSSARRFSKQELSDEALYYGIDSRLRRAMSPPPFSGIDASIVSTVNPAADGLPSAFSAGEDGSVWIAHGGQISSFDWILSYGSTVRTHLEKISSIRRVFPEVAAVGSESGAGLHFYDFAGSKHIGSTHWTDPSDPRIYKARVTSVTDSPSHLYAAFDCLHRENSVLSIDKNTLQIVSEIGRQSGSSTKNVVPGKLTWLPETGVIIGSAVTSGAFGYSGYIRIWDPRMGSIIWETNEPGSGRSSRYRDSFADVAVDVESSLLFKVGSNSGDLAMADLRNLREDPWVYLKEKNPSMNLTGDETSVVMHCYKGQVFVGRDGALEVWSKVVERGEEVERTGEALYRRNFVDKVEDSQRGFITNIEGGGDRLFVSREGVEGIEVWETSYLSGATSFS